MDIDKMTPEALQKLIDDERRILAMKDMASKDGMVKNAAKIQWRKDMVMFAFNYITGRPMSESEFIEYTDYFDKPMDMPRGLIDMGHFNIQTYIEYKKVMNEVLEGTPQQ